MKKRYIITALYFGELKTIDCYDIETCVKRVSEIYENQCYIADVSMYKRWISGMNYNDYLKLSLVSIVCVQYDYENLACQYCENHGIIQYDSIIENKMVYRTNWKSEHTTYKVIVNLDTMEEIERTPLKRYYKKYNYNYCL